MARDITYCSNEDCPFEDCIRHMAQLADEPKPVIISIANFGGVCRQYIGSIVEYLCEQQEHGIHFEEGLYLREDDY